MLKDVFGCKGPPQPTGSFKFGPENEVRAEIYQCPVKELEGCQDVWELIRSGSLAEWRLTFSEQGRIPSRYLDAWMMARNEVEASIHESTKRGKDA